MLLLGLQPCRAATATRTYVITEHGAVGDGTTVNTRAIQETIDACAAAGGGMVVVVPAGVFKSGALFFKRGVNLELQQNAVLASTTQMADFPPVYTRWEGIERYWTCAFLNFIGMEHVVVSGSGTIDGAGLDWPGQPRAPRGPRPPGKAAAAPAPAQQREPLPSIEQAYPGKQPTTAALSLAPHPAHLPPINAAGIELPDMARASAALQNPNRLAPPRAVVFQDCSDVRVEGVHLKNPARWGFVFIYCRNVTARNLTVATDRYIPSSDGIDVCSCSDVRISGCDIACHDDNISIKSGKDADGRRVNRPSENIVIEDCRYGSGGGVAMGSEVTGSIRHVLVQRCTFVGTGSAARIKSQPSRGGVIEDVVFRDLHLTDVSRAINFDLAWRLVPPLAPPAKDLTRVSGIRLINITGTAESAGLIRGYADRPFAAPDFEHVELTVQHGLMLEHVAPVHETGLALKVANGPALVQVQPGSVP